MLAVLGNRGETERQMAAQDDTFLCQKLQCTKHTGSPSRGGLCSDRREKVKDWR